MKIFFGVILVLLTLVACAPAEDQNTLSIKHEVSFYHAASKTGKPESNILYELPDHNDESDVSRYFMDVSSVYCGEEVCKVDTVRLFWNEIGQYTKFTLRPNVKLEKGDAEDFEPDDYQKLDRILANKDSDLASLQKNELVAPQSGGNAVDALTGATIAMRKTDYIQGAVWTCYTLWHFAYGEIVNIIRNISGKRKSIEELRTLLIGNDVNYQIFALQQLTKRKDISIDNLNVLVRKLEQGESSIFSGAIDYLNILSNKDYYHAAGRFLSIENSQLRALIFENLVNNERLINIAFYTNTAKKLFEWQQYQDVKQFLTVLEQKNIDNKAINDVLSELLHHQNFIISRGVYWYLKQQPEANINAKMMDDFFSLHHERL